MLDRAGEERAVVGGARHVSFGRLAERLPRIAGFEPRQLFAMVHQQVAEAPQDLGPLARRHPRPRSLVERAPGRRHRQFDVGRITGAHVGDRLVGGRIERREGRAADGIDERAIDIQAPFEGLAMGW